MSLLKRAASHATFAARLVIFMLAPLLATSPSALWVMIAAVIFTWLIDFIRGHTTWISVRTETLLVYIIFLAALAATALLHNNHSIPFIIVALLLLILLSSDAISHSGRWKLLLPTMALSWLFYILGRPRLSPSPEDFEHTYLPSYDLLLFSLIPAIAALSRLLFPRTKHLIHTSLDYRPVRVEVLSFGMKRAVAIGIKKLTD